MKFIGSNDVKYWREKGECCMFVEVRSVVADSGTTAELEVIWCKQLDRGWKQIGKEIINIRSNNYMKWVSYFPRGEKVL